MSTEIHVVPLPDGAWSVRATPHGPPLSIHGDATAAARSAVDGARRYDATRVILHDRYGRARTTHVRRGAHELTGVA